MSFMLRNIILIGPKERVHVILNRHPQDAGERLQGRRAALGAEAESL